MRTVRHHGAGDRRALARIACALAVATMSACVFPATEAICLVATDVPVTTQLTIRVQATAGTSVGDGAWEHGWVTTGDGGTGITLPASFAVVPPPGQDDATVTVVVEALGPGFVLRRIARVQMVPNQTVYVPVFLARSCANVATGCASGSGPSCTVEEYCEEHGMSCGEMGECVPLDDGTTDAGGIDATVSDIARVPDVVVCGAVYQPCCEGVTCMGTNLVCSVGTCVACGAIGEPCCAGDACAAGGTCTSGTCVVPCGAIGQPCCAGNACDGTATCMGSTCAASPPPCGAVGESCCAGGTCNAGVQCASGMCRTPCGAVGQPCCAGNACGGEENCLTGMCYACGAHGQTCCLTGGTACGASLVCVGTGFGPICECGGVGQVCCAGGTCSPGGNCDSGSCSACGANGHTCCFTGTACSDGTSACYGSGFGPLCGFPAYTACGGSDFCQPNFTCASTSHGMICCGNPGTGCTASWQCCGSTLCISGSCN